MIDRRTLGAVKRLAFGAVSTTSGTPPARAELRRHRARYGAASRAASGRSLRRRRRAGAARAAARGGPVVAGRLLGPGVVAAPAAGRPRRRCRCCSGRRLPPPRSRSWCARRGRGSRSCWCSARSAGCSRRPQSTPTPTSARSLVDPAGGGARFARHPARRARVQGSARRGDGARRRARACRPRPGRTVCRWPWPSPCRSSSRPGSASRRPVLVRRADPADLAGLRPLAQALSDGWDVAPPEPAGGLQAGGAAARRRAVVGLPPHPVVELLRGLLRPRAAGSGSPRTGGAGRSGRGRCSALRRRTAPARSVAAERVPYQRWATSMTRRLVVASWIVKTRNGSRARTPRPIEV